jgi:hypothetical protein
VASGSNLALSKNGVMGMKLPQFGNGTIIPLLLVVCPYVADKPLGRSPENSN